MRKRKIVRRFFFITLLGLIVWLLGIFYQHNMNANAFGVYALNQLKQLIETKVDFEVLHQGTRDPISHQGWDSLLQQYVNVQGEVDYASWKKEPAGLQAYLDLLSQNPPSSSWSESEQLAYWINAYNAYTIALVLDHYPLESIKDIAGSIPFINSSFDVKFFEIGGFAFDLNTIEHQVLRAQFEEPRIHFAINCASFSCPRLLNEAYTADRLDAQLQAQAKEFINDPNKNKLTADQVALSMIFSWFEGDFTKNGSLVAFLNQYSETPIATAAEINHMTYDWSLNGVK
ncbi:MAG: DUF547 domain-containing protein [Bacteroidota bacterium]